MKKGEFKMIHIEQIEMGMIGTNCYIVSDEKKNCVIIDCDGTGKEVFCYIEQNQLKPCAILLTHGHFDHVGAVEAVKEKYQCDVCIGADDADLLAEPKLNCSYLNGRPIHITADKLFSDNEIFTVGEMQFKILFTPGHTQGSICFLIENNIISGDTLFAGSCGRTDLPTGDWDTLLKSLQKLKALEGDYKVFPGHGPATTLSYERTHNPYM